MAAQAQWHFTGDYFENCNCSVVCPCLVSKSAPLTSRPTEGVCSLRVMGTAFATGQACGVAAARYAHKADSLVAEIRTALREQGALIDGDDLPDPVALQYS